MDAETQKEVDVYPLWHEQFQKIRDDLIRHETKLETIIAVDRTKFDPYDAAKSVVGMLHAVRSFYEVTDIFIRAIGTVQERHNIVHTETAQLRTDFDTYVKDTEKTFEAINNFMSEYKDMLKELANERNIRNRVTRPPPPPPNPQQGGTPRP